MLKFSLCRLLGHAIPNAVDGRQTPSSSSNISGQKAQRPPPSTEWHSFPVFILVQNTNSSIETSKPWIVCRWSSSLSPRRDPLVNEASITVVKQRKNDTLMIARVALKQCRKENFCYRLDVRWRRWKWIGEYVINCCDSYNIVDVLCPWFFKLNKKKKILSAF